MVNQRIRLKDLIKRTVDRVGDDLIRELGLDMDTRSLKVLMTGIAKQMFKNLSDLLWDGTGELVARDNKNRILMRFGWSAKYRAKKLDEHFMNNLKKNGKYKPNYKRENGQETK